MAVGGTFGLFWAVTLLFASKTKGERSMMIPLVWILLFLGITGFGGVKWTEAQSNPPKLTKTNYLSLKKGMSLNDAKNSLDFIDPVKMAGLDETQRERYDLTSNRIRMPSEVMGRLSPGVYGADRKDSRIAVTLNGVPSKRGDRNSSYKDEDGMKPQLGSSATFNERAKQGHGVKGLQFRIFVSDDEALETMKEERSALREENADNEDFEMPFMIPPAQEGKEWIFVEGEHWEYEDEMTAAQVAEKMAEIINADPNFSAEYEVDEDAMEPSTKFIIQPAACLPIEEGEEVDENDPCKKDGQKSNEFTAEASNSLRAQVLSGDNLAVQLGIATNGKMQRFVGGANQVKLEFWQEEDPFFDDDFNTTPRLIVGGFVNGELFALGQNGLEVTKEEEPIKIEKKED
jgi:hypothetical protein